MALRNSASEPSPPGPRHLEVDPRVRVGDRQPAAAPLARGDRERDVPEREREGGGAALGFIREGLRARAPASARRTRPPGSRRS